MKGSSKGFLNEVDIRIDRTSAAFRNLLKNLEGLLREGFGTKDHQQRLLGMAQECWASIKELEGEQQS